MPRWSKLSKVTKNRGATTASGALATKRSLESFLRMLARKPWRCWHSITIWECELKPKVENFCGGVQVTIERTKFMQMTNVVSDVTSNVVSNVVSLSQVQLTDRQKKMANLIKDNPFISAQEMSVVLSVVHRTIQRDLAAMQKMGVLIREGNTSAGHWVIIQK